MKYFLKELPTNRLFLPSGKQVPFEIAGEIGIISLNPDTPDDLALIKELEKAVERHIGGVVAINEEEYERVKKNPPGRNSRAKPFANQLLQQMQRQQSNPSAKNGVAAAEPVRSQGEALTDKFPATSKLRDVRRPGQTQQSVGQPDA